MSDPQESGTTQFFSGGVWVSILALAAIFAAISPPADQNTPEPPRSPQPAQKQSSEESGNLEGLACSPDTIGGLGWFFGDCEPRAASERAKSCCFESSATGFKPCKCEGDRTADNGLENQRLREALLASLQRNPSLELQFAILLLPDPNYRALGTLTDSFLDAYSLGLGDVGLVPFTPGPALWPNLKLATEKVGMQANRPQQPGVWVFSESKGKTLQKILLTLVVAENPVSGANQGQLKHALIQIESTRKAFSSLKTTQFLIGPTFSGSARSVSEAIRSVELSYQLTGASATASNPGLSEDMKFDTRKLQWQQLAVPDPTCNAITDLRNSIARGKRIAVLQEGNTVYGLSVNCKKAEGQPDLIAEAIPSDLAALRKAYSEHKSLYSQFFPSAKEGPTSLPIPLRNSNTEGESIYAGETLAKSQETALLTFARKLRAEHIPFLGLITTDRLDSLFLASFFRRHSPNAQIFLVGSDALFNAEGSRGLLTGILTYSSTPIGLASKDATLAANDLSARLRATVSRVLGGDKSIADQALYASVLGRGGEWPLHVVSGSMPKEWQAIGHWGATAGFFLCIAAILAIPVLRFFSSQMESVLPSWFSNRLRSHCPYAHWTKVPILSHFTDRHLEGRETKRMRWILAYAFGWVLISAGLSIFFVRAYLGTNTALQSRFRALLNGVNPVIPVLCFALILMAFAWMRIRARYLDNYTFHVLPAEHMITPKMIKDDLIHANQEGFCSRWMLLAIIAGLFVLTVYDLAPRDIERGGLLFNSYVWSTLSLLCCVLVISCIAHFWRLWRLLVRVLSALEAHPIRNAFTRLPERVSWTSVWSFSGLTPSFVPLQLATDYLNVFSSLRIVRPDDLLCGSILDKSRDILIRAKVGNVPDMQLGVESDTEFKPLREELASVIKESESFAQRINVVLHPVWGESALEGWRGAKQDWSRQSAAKEHYPLGSTGPTRNPRVISKWDDERKLMEEYIATLYCSYITYEFAQLRNLAGCITISASLLFLAYSAYPFQPHGALMNSVTFLFALLAITFIVVFQQMDRDPILSRLSDTSAGKLDAGFAMRLLQFGLLPSVTFLAGQIPGVSDLLLRVMEVIPGLPK